LYQRVSDLVKPWYPQAMLPVGIVLSAIITLELVRGIFGGSATRAAEFYSWIDPGGTMVMTDDPSRIPAASLRSPISIHRFEEVRPTESRIRQERGQTERQTEGLSDEDHRNAEGPRSTDSRSEPKPSATELQKEPKAEAPLPPVVLEAPEDSTRTQYLWIPLVTPVLVGSHPVTGFWCHRGVSSPVDAFKTFLSQQLSSRQQVLIAGGQLQLNNMFNVSVPVSPGVVQGPATPIFDQVLQERQMLMDRSGRQPARLQAPSRLGTSGPRNFRRGGHRGPLR
jgi:hypothetical protein